MSRSSTKANEKYAPEMSAQHGDLIDERRHGLAIQTRASAVRRRGGPRRGLLARFFEGSSHFFCALEGTPDIVVIGAAVEREQLEAMRALHLKAVANPLKPLSENPGALRAFDLDLVL
jgi:hypothetical protein